MYGEGMRAWRGPIPAAASQRADVPRAALDRRGDLSARVGARARAEQWWWVRQSDGCVGRGGDVREFDGQPWASLPLRAGGWVKFVRRAMQLLRRGTVSAAATAVCRRRAGVPRGPQQRRNQQLRPDLQRDDAWV